MHGGIVRKNALQLSLDVTTQMEKSMIFRYFKWKTINLLVRELIIKITSGKLQETVKYNVGGSEIDYENLISWEIV